MQSKGLGHRVNPKRSSAIGCSVLLNFINPRTGHVNLRETNIITVLIISHLLTCEMHLHTTVPCVVLSGEAHKSLGFSRHLMISAVRKLLLLSFISLFPLVTEVGFLYWFIFCNLIYHPQQTQIPQTLYNSQDHIFCQWEQRQLVFPSSYDLFSCHIVIAKTFTTVWNGTGVNKSMFLRRKHPFSLE